MKIRNQSSLPSKYWLLIIAFFCVVLMGIEHATGGNGPLYCQLYRRSYAEGNQLHGNVDQ